MTTYEITRGFFANRKMISLFDDTIEKIKFKWMCDEAIENSLKKGNYFFTPHDIRRYLVNKYGIAASRIMITNK